jgi:tetratricopeptide (TPR) repeat protein
MIRGTLSWCLVGCCLLLVALPALGQEYKSAREARAAAANHLRSRNFAAAQAPLEAALKLTPESDTKERTEIYRTLMAAYRLLPEPDKMLEAVEYIQTNSESQAERSIVANDLVSFMHQRGKLDQAVSRYEERLKKDAQDPTALAILSTVYKRIRDEKKARGQELEAALKKLNVDRASAKAEKLSVSADTAPAAAASAWKDVAKAWLEAGKKDQARIAIDRSRTATPESRSTLSSMFWHEGVAEVLGELGETADAIKEYEAAVAAAPNDVLKKSMQAKLDKFRAGGK